MKQRNFLGDVPYAACPLPGNPTNNEGSRLIHKHPTNDVGASVPSTEWQKKPAAWKKRCPCVIIFGCFFLPLFASEKGYTWRIIPFGKWLVSMAIVSPRRIGLWDPFQMAELYVLFLRVILTTYIHRDDPPGFQASTLRCCFSMICCAKKKNVKLVTKTACAPS